MAKSFSTKFFHSIPDCSVKISRGYFNIYWRHKYVVCIILSDSTMCIKPCTQSHSHFKFYFHIGFKNVLKNRWEWRNRSWRRYWKQQALNWEPFKSDSSSFVGIKLLSLSPILTFFLRWLTDRFEYFIIYLLWGEKWKKLLLKVSLYSLWSSDYWSGRQNWDEKCWTCESFVGAFECSLSRSSTAAAVIWSRQSWSQHVGFCSFHWCGIGRFSSRQQDFFRIMIWSQFLLF